MSKKRKKTGLQNILFFLSSFLALVTGIALVGWADRYSIVWRYSMFLNTPNIMLGVCIIIATCATTPIIIWFKKQTVPHAGSNSNSGIWMPILLIGFPLLMCTTQIGVIINGALDKSETQTVHTVVVNKRESNAGRWGKHYYIQVEDWRDSHRTVQVKVSKSNFDAIQLGDSIVIQAKSGFLGYEWMVGPDFMKGKWPFVLPDN